MEHWTQFTLLVLGVSSLAQVSGLTCYVGLGNNSQRRSQKVVNCPEDRHYVCVKMYGGDMGDQIRRKCEKMSVPEYEELMEQEALKERMIQKGESWDVDPACHEDVHHGRDVHVCYCSIDQCNSAFSMRHKSVGMIQILAIGLSIFRHKIVF
ncbi:hypothetical protein TCAL_05135 [Tigriopus californicus]|uniref:Protein sleepless n=1 Tax=Tigriopus californicus TaxID=6832 RepID=A0A553NCR4_TIGCA|nr:uncharacterized protein LOC131888185 [Tigriopus californicus]TRY63227.1 hypothetical protein TCAL_05135 [Tigriopus californicus]|eukprot:TCALIF_05135-PA protein Name:"Protein of unknown function" AED:0.00 eAED:0.00 QI:15/1/1/1/1/1/3/103/151